MYYKSYIINMRIYKNKKYNLESYQIVGMNINKTGMKKILLSYGRMVFIETCLAQ